MPSSAWLLWLANLLLRIDAAALGSHSRHQSQLEEITLPVPLQDEITSTTPIPCKYGGWGPWTTCACGTGQKRERHRVRLQGPPDRCDATVETEECEPIICNPCVDGLPSNKMKIACNKTTSVCEFLSEGPEPYYQCNCFGGYTLNITEKKMLAGCYDCCLDIDECADVSMNDCSDFCLDGYAVPQNYTCGCNSARFPTSTGADEATGASRVCVTCQFSDWSTWTSCSESCGQGTTVRTKVPTGESALHPSECSVQTETDACYIGPCTDAGDCRYSSWSHWSECSVSCVNGTQGDQATTGRRNRQRYLIAGSTSLCDEVIKDSEECVGEGCAISHGVPEVFLAAVGVLVGASLIAVLIFLGAKCYRRRRARMWEYEDPL